MDSHELRNSLKSSFAFTDGYIQRLQDEILNDPDLSDHSAYRELADAVTAVMGEESDPDEWDGDTTELELLKSFLSWLPDIVRHKDADRIREEAKTQGYNTALAYTRAANLIDPFELRRDDEGFACWYRKTDNQEVPWNVAKINGEDHEL